MSGLWGWFPALCRTAAYAAAVLACAPFVYHLARGSNAYLGLLEDDYFYYAIIADRLVLDGRMTYDGTTLTNGVHPLWFAVITALRAICGRFGPAFYLGLTLISLASLIATYELGRRFARRLGAGEPLACAVAIIPAVGSGMLLTSGMECVVAVPLYLWLLVEIARPGPVTEWRAAKLGLIASLAILARLDLVLAVALLLAGFALFARPPLAAGARLLLAFCAGGLLLPLYLAANVLFFGSPIPVSALAKQQLVASGFNLTYVLRVARGTAYGSTVALLLPLGLLAFALLLLRDGLRRPAASLAGGVALVFPVLFYALNARTGWTFFGWYAYPLAAALIAALVFAGERWGRWVPRPAAALAAILVVALVPASAVRYYIQHGPRWSIADNPLLAMSQELEAHVGEKDGRFAMGAIAGFVTYALDRPVFQLEGIVGDHALLESIEREAPLEDVLRAYRVDYLVVSTVGRHPDPRDGCYLVTEPNAEWAGPWTKKLRGEICAEPMTRFVTPWGGHRWSRFTDLETLVWDLRGARWKRMGAVAGASASRHSTR